MAKGIKKETGEEQFNKLLSHIDSMARSTEEIMPLFAASLELSKKILKMYNKAFLLVGKNGK